MTVKPIKLLLDEHIWVGLAEILVQRGYDVTHIITLAQRGIDDESVLALATTQDRAVFTNNMRDFVPLARRWVRAWPKACGYHSIDSITARYTVEANGAVASDTFR